MGRAVGAVHYDRHGVCDRRSAPNRSRVPGRRLGRCRGHRPGAAAVAGQSDRPVGLRRGRHVLSDGRQGAAAGRGLPDELPHGVPVRPAAVRPAAGGRQPQSRRPAPVHPGLRAGAGDEPVLPRRLRHGRGDLALRAAPPRRADADRRGGVDAVRLRAVPPAPAHLAPPPLVVCPRTDRRAVRTDDHGGRPAVRGSPPTLVARVAARPTGMVGVRRLRRPRLDRLVLRGLPRLPRRRCRPGHDPGASSPPPPLVGADRRIDHAGHDARQHRADDRLLVASRIEPTGLQPTRGGDRAVRPADPAVVHATDRPSGRSPRSPRLSRLRRSDLLGAGFLPRRGHRHRLHRHRARRAGRPRRAGRRPGAGEARSATPVCSGSWRC